MFTVDKVDMRNNHVNYDYIHISYIYGYFILQGFNESNSCTAATARTYLADWNHIC